MATDNPHPRVTAVIPAFNEGPRIGVVLDAVLASRTVGDVLVIDDGSTDDTAEVAAARGARVVRRQHNGGKGAAMETARPHLSSHAVVFVDADLVGLTPDHVDALVAPLLEAHGPDMTVGRFEGGRKRTDLAQRIIPQISGQRGMTREFLETLPNLDESRFGVEVVVTRHGKDVQAKVVEVVLSNITQVMKEEKLGLTKGVTARAQMYGDILRHSVLKRRPRRRS